MIQQNRNIREGADFDLDYEDKANLRPGQFGKQLADDYIRVIEKTLSDFFTTTKHESPSKKKMG